MRALVIGVIATAVVLGWDKYESMHSSKHTMEIKSSFVDPETHITHMVFKDDSEVLYIQLDRKKRTLVKRSLAPLDRFFSVSESCITGSGMNLTIVSTLANQHHDPYTVDPYYMTSDDAGNSWTDYHPIHTVYQENGARLAHSLTCPLVFVKENKRVFAVFTVENMTDDARPFKFAIVSKSGDSKIFGRMRVFAHWKQYRHHYFSQSAHTMSSMQPILHVVSYGNDSLVYTRSANNGITWSTPKVIIPKCLQFSHSTLMITHNSSIYLTYQPTYDSPPMVAISRDHGISWTADVQLLDSKNSSPFSLKVCCCGEKCNVWHFFHCESDTACLNEWDLDMSNRENRESPFRKVFRSISGAHLDCANTGLMVAFTNQIDYEARHDFIVSHQDPSDSAFPPGAGQ